MDVDGYPTEEELEKIREWDLLAQPVSGFLELLRQSWHWGFKEKHWKNGTIRLYMATGGWSGNESVISAMQDNFIFWSVCWQAYVPLIRE